MAEHLLEGGKPRRQKLLDLIAVRGNDAGNPVGAGAQRIGHLTGAGGQGLGDLFGGLPHRVRHLGGARDKVLGHTGAGRFELLGHVAAAQIEVEDDRFSGSLQRRVHFLGA